MNHSSSVLSTVLTLTLGLSAPSWAAPANPAQADQEELATPGDQLATVSGRAVLIGPDGTRQEFSFGEPDRKRRKKAIEQGGARLDVKLAPDTAALRLLGSELEAIYKTNGVGPELFAKALAAVENLDSLGDFQIRGRLVGPEQKSWKLELGDDLAAKPQKFDRKMEDGGAHLELGVTPGPVLLDLLTLADHAPAALRLLEFGINNPDKLELLDKALHDPNLIPLLEKTLHDPQANNLLQKALQNPALTDLVARQLSGGNAGALLGLLGRSAKPTEPEAAPDQSSHKTTDPAPAGHDAELEALRQEVAAQRALLEKILEKLAAE